MTEVSEKPVYKTGESVGNIVATNESIAATPTLAPTPEPAPPVPDPVAPAAAVPDTPAAPTPTPEVVEPNVSKFSFGDFDTPAPAATVTETPAAPAATNWKDALKSADPKEILKELGFNEFAIEINEHLKNGGDAADYLSAKAVDYNKISDADILKADLKKQYPSFTADQINLLFEDKYDTSEEVDDRKKQIKELNLQADAYNSRQAKISEQQKFKIPVSAQVQNSEQQAAITQQQQAQVEAARQWFAEHEATKNLINSKRVALSLGDNGTFNFNIERPELLMKAVTDGETWQKLTLNKQGEPDVAKMQKIALYAFNPEQFENDLVNYGKSLALPKILEEGQNITPGAKVIPVQGANVQEKDLWKTAKSSTIGGGR